MSTKKIVHQVLVKVEFSSSLSVAGMVSLAARLAVALRNRARSARKPELCPDFVKALSLVEPRLGKGLRYPVPSQEVSPDSRLNVPNVIFRKGNNLSACQALACYHERLGLSHDTPVKHKEAETLRHYGDKSTKSLPFKDGFTYAQFRDRVHNEVLDYSGLLSSDGMTDLVENIGEGSHQSRYHVQWLMTDPQRALRLLTFINESFKVKLSDLATIMAEHQAWVDKELRRRQVKAKAEARKQELRDIAARNARIDEELKAAIKIIESRGMRVVQNGKSS